MQKLRFKKLIGLFISLVLIFTLGVTTSIAQQKTKIAGKHTLAYKQDTINVGDTEGHIIALSEFEGFNVSTGEEKFMDGAQDVAMGFSDLVMGNGTDQGYGNISLNGDVIFWKHQGNIATTISPEGKLVTTAEGSWTFTKGTGKYENIQASGTYKGKLMSRTIYIIEWEGEYFIKK
jgi:hypothetical protein